MDETELLTATQAAEALSATSQTIRNWIRAERLRAVRIGHRFLIPRAEVERLRGELGASAGESPWDYEQDAPGASLVRPRRGRAAAAESAGEMLGG
jgi:excisionase family DNA binding protein